MNQLNQSSPDPGIHLRSTLISVAAFVIVVAGVRVAANLINPILLGAFLAIVSAPAYLWLRERGWPSFLALTMLAIPPAIVTLLIGLLIGSSGRCKK